MLLFFDGREAAQRAQARELVARHRGRVKPILVAGPVVALSREWGERLYFDQGGVLVRWLGIRQVPALVAQAGRVLRVEELRP
jgi:conjugal transfer pilus assembly protein TraW